MANTQKFKDYVKLVTGEKKVGQHYKAEVKSLDAVLGARSTTEAAAKLGRLFLKATGANVRNYDDSEIVGLLHQGMSNEKYGEMMQALSGPEPDAHRALEAIREGYMQSHRQNTLMVAGTQLEELSLSEREEVLKGMAEEGLSKAGDGVFKTDDLGVIVNKLVSNLGLSGPEMALKIREIAGIVAQTRANIRSLLTPASGDGYKNKLAKSYTEEKGYRKAA